MADQGGNVRQALADQRARVRYIARYIARQATCLLQRYENGDVNTIENDIITHWKILQIERLEHLQ